MMRVPMRDGIATMLVAIGVLMYGAWALGVEMAALSSVGSVAAAILVLGVAASASAVVPAFDELLHGSRAYLAGASALGVVALAAGVLAMVNGNAVALAALVLATVALWALATNRHLVRPGPEAHLGPR